MQNSYEKSRLRVDLETYDQEKIRQLAQQRTQSCIENGTDNTNCGITDEQSDTIGSKGEVAFSKLYDLDLSQQPVAQNGPDESDFQVCWNGQVQSVDVKTTKYPSAHCNLLVHANRTLSSDIYVLASAPDHQATVEFIGFATSQDVTRREPRRFPRNNLNFVLSPDQLRTMPTATKVTNDYNNRPRPPKNRPHKTNGQTQTLLDQYALSD